MKIGFDLDGVLASQDTTTIVLMIKDSLVEQVYYETRKPLLNPYLFLTETDEACIITARKASLKKITRAWCQKFFPSIKLFQLPLSQWKDKDDVQNWFRKVAKQKASLINKLGLDVYFEDMPETVKELRKLCPDCKIVQYGGRLTAP